MVAQQKMNQEDRKGLVNESAKTRKAREKLKLQHRIQDEKITSEALDNTTEDIRRWISKHASNRVILRDKNISLFNENQNPAKISRTIESVFQKIKKEISS
ncbi:MAG: hypothetical protein WCP39_02980 [Chlamydiota bacterium]